MGMKRSGRLMWGMGKASSSPSPSPSSSSSSSSPPAPAYVRQSGDEKRRRSSSGGGGGGGGGGGRGCKGKVPVLVGGEGEAMERLLIPTEMMKHPAIAALLQMSADEFGYRQQGAIRIPCDVDSLRTTLDMISKQTTRPPSWRTFLSHKLCSSSIQCFQTLFLMRQ